jgi:hypothetical protein
MLKRITPFIFSVLFLQSCYVQYHSYGNGPDVRGAAPDRYQEYSHAKAFYLIYGLIPINEPDAELPKDGNYTIKTGINFWDSVVSGITLGIFCMCTERVYVNSEKK